MITRKLGRLALGAIWMTASAVQAQVVYYRFSPTVIPQSQTGDVVFESRITGAPSSVRIDLASGTSIPLLDDGSGADAAPNDGIYSTALSATDLLHDFALDDVNRNFVGYLRVFEGGSQTIQVNVFIDVLTPDIPAVTIRSVTPTMQHSEHLVNIVAPAFFNTFDAAAVAQALYSHFADTYDFINVIFEFPHPQNADHFTIRNDVANIGAPIRDHSAAWGSNGRLLGRSQFPLPTMFDGASPHYLHELGHQWVNYLTVPPLNLVIAHWPLSDLASDIMGWADAPNSQGLTFNFELQPEGSDFRLIADDAPKVYSDLSLYLMGFAAPSEVGEHFVFNNQSQVAAPNGLLVGPVTTVSIADVIVAMGPRVPDHTRAQRTFRIATVLVSRSLVSADVMRLYDHFSARAGATAVVRFSTGFQKGFANPFHLATQGRARLDARILHRVLVDASRDGGSWWSPQSGPFNPDAPHQGKALADRLRASGYLVSELPRPSTVTNAHLQGQDIVIRAGGFGNYTSAEISAYQSYVWSGGNLLILADHFQTGAMDNLSHVFGLQFRGVTRGANAITTFATHAITNGVGPLPYVAGSGLVSYPAGAQILGLLPGTGYIDLNRDGTRSPGEPTNPPVMGVMTYGAGKIVFCGDVNLWQATPQTLLRNLLAWFEKD